MTNPNCIFCKIVAGEIPSYKLYENDRFLAFLEINPIQTGHTLLVTKDHIATIYDMPKELFCEFTNLAREIAPAIKRVTGCHKVGLSVLGLDMEHAHIHILPLNSAEDTNFADQKPARPEDLAEIAKKIGVHILN